MLAYLIRHAESRSNVSRAEGLNEGLTDLGRRQAEALADRLRAVPLRAVYASPFLRSIETALSIAAAAGLPAALRPDLCEHHHLAPGTLVDTGLEPVAAITARFPQTRRCPDYRGSFEWVPADETFAQLVARMQGFAAYLKARWTGEDDAVVVVSHGSPIARLIEAWLIDRPGPSFRFIIDNAAVCALRYHAGVSTLVCLNEVSHLAGLPPPAAANYRPDGSIKARPDANVG